MLRFSKWTERVLASSQLEREELMLNQGRPTNERPYYVFESVEKVSSDPAPLLGRDRAAASFPALV